MCPVYERGIDAFSKIWFESIQGRDIKVSLGDRSKSVCCLCQTYEGSLVHEYSSRVFTFQYPDKQKWPWIWF